MIICGCYAGMEWSEGGYVKCWRGCWRGMFFYETAELKLWKLLYE